MPRIAALALACLLGGCGLLSTDIQESLSDISIPASADAGQPMDQSQAVSIAKQDTGPATFAQLDQLTFTIDESSATPTFDFLSEVHVYVQATGQPEVEVANLNSVPPGANTIDLNADPNVNLIPYLGSGCTVDVEVVGTSPSAGVVFGGSFVIKAGI